MSEYYLCSEGEVMKAALPSDTSLNTFRPRLETQIEFAGKFSDSELNSILDSLSKAYRQHEVLSAYIRLTGYTQGSQISSVPKELLLRESGASSNAIDTLIKKGIFKTISLSVTRLNESLHCVLPKIVQHNPDSQKTYRNAYNSYPGLGRPKHAKPA